MANPINIVISATNNAKKTVQDATKDLESFKATAKSAGLALVGFLGINLSGEFAKSLIETADKWLSLNAQIRTATTSSDEFTVSQQAVLDISRKTYTSLEANAGLFSKVNLAIKAMGGNTQQAIQTVDQVAKLVALSGTSAESAAAGIFQFTQSLAANRFSGQEYNSVAEQTPALLKAIYEGLNVNIGTLRKMAEEGQLDTQTVLRALENSSARTDAAFAKLPITFSKATQNMSNSWLTLIGRLNESTGVTANLASGLNFVADNLETIVTVSAKVGAGALVVGFARLTQSAGGYTKSLLENINAERAAQKAEIEAAQTKVARKTQFLDTAKAAAQEANAKAILARENLALLKTDIQVEQQKLRQALANRALAQSQLAAVRSTFGAGTQAEATALNKVALATQQVNAQQTKLVAVSNQAALAQKNLTSAVAAQSQAQRVVTASTQFQIAAQEQLNVATAQSSVLMTRLKGALSNVVGFLGGGFGVALLGLYAAYQVMEALTDSTEKAEAKAKLFEDRLKQVNDSISQIKSPEELANRFADAEMQAEILRLKIAELEQFNFDNIGNLWGNASKRAALQSDLDLTKKTIQSINDRQNDLIRSFDVLSLSPEQLNTELGKTTEQIEQLKNHINELRTKEKDGSIELYEIEALSKDEARLKAFESKAKAINQQLGKEANSPEGFKKQQSKAEEITAINKIAYERDIRNLEQAEQAKLAAIAQSKLSERDKLNQSVATEIEFNNKRLQASVQYNLQRLQMTTQLYQQEIDLNKQRNLSTEQLEKDANAAKKSILLELEKGYEGSIAKLDALDKQHRDKAISYLKQIDDAQLARAQRRDQLETIGLNDKQAYEKQAELIERDRARASELLKQGEHTKAIALLESLEQRQFELAQKSTQAEADATAKNKQYAKDYHDYQIALQNNNIQKAQELAQKLQQQSGLFGDDAGARAYESKIASKASAVAKLSEIEKQTDAARQAAAANENKQADTAKANADKQREALAKTQEQLTAIDGLLSKANILKIDVDTAAIDAAKRAIETIPSEKIVHIKTVEGHQTGGIVGVIKRASGGIADFTNRVRGKISGFGGGDQIRALLERGEYVFDKWTVKKYGQRTLDAVRRGEADIIYRSTGGIANHQIRLPDFVSQKLSTVKMPNMPQLSSSITQPTGSRDTIDLNLMYGDLSAVGSFPKTDPLNEILKVMKEKQRSANRG